MVVSLKTLVFWNSLGIRIRCKHTSTISAVSLTFWLLSQTGMWARGWVWEAIAVYDLWVILGWGLGAPWQGRVWEIHMVEPKLLLITCCPLQVVHQCPGSVAPQVDTVEHKGCRRSREKSKQVSATPRPARAGGCSRTSTRGTQAGYCQQAGSLSAQDWTLLFSAPKIKAFVQEIKV